MDRDFALAGAHRVHGHDHLEHGDVGLHCPPGRDAEHLAREPLAGESNVTVFDVIVEADAEARKTLRPMLTANIEITKNMPGMRPMEDMEAMKTTADMKSCSATASGRL